MESDKTALSDLITELLKNTERLRGTLRKTKSAQVRTKTETGLVLDFSMAWLRNFQGRFSNSNNKWETLNKVNLSFTKLSEWSHVATTRSRYLDLLKTLQADLIQLRSEVLSGAHLLSVPQNIPQLENLVPNSEMRQIIYRRWQEADRCVESAPLACVVMMGALLEALLLARVNKLDSQDIIFKQKSTPIDRETKKPLALPKWTLSNYIAVSHDLGWIRKAAKDVGVTLMEYRNLIHPEKQLRLKITIEPQDSRMFRAIFHELSKQIIESAGIGGD